MSTKHLSDKLNLEFSTSMKFFIFSMILLPMEVFPHGALVSVRYADETGMPDVSGPWGSRNWQLNQIGTDKREYNTYGLNGIGGRVDEFDNPGGEPGDTGRQNSQWYTTLDSYWYVGTEMGKRVSPKTFRSGDAVKFGVKVTANHGGIFEYRYFCADQKKSQGINTIETLDFYDAVDGVSDKITCIEQNHESNVWRENGASGTCYAPRNLERIATNEESNTVLPSRPEWYILSKDPKCFTDDLGDEKMVEMTYRLPDTQCTHLVVQWWWQTSNSCVMHAWKQAINKNEFPCGSSDWYNSRPGDCNPFADNKSPSNSGEQFANLIDFQLTSSNDPSVVTTKAAKTSTTRKSSTPTVITSLQSETTEATPDTFPVTSPTSNICPLECHAASSGYECQATNSNACFNKNGGTCPPGTIECKSSGITKDSTTKRYTSTSAPSVTFPATTNIDQESTGNKFISSDGNFEASWQRNGDQITFSYAAPSEGYIALGFKQDNSRNMVNMDVYIGSQGKSITDRHSQGFSIPSLDSDSGGENNILQSACNEDSSQKLSLRCTFTRKINTADARDFNLAGSPFYIVYAYGAGDAEDPTFHQGNRGISDSSFTFAQCPSIARKRQRLLSPKCDTEIDENGCQVCKVASAGTRIHGMLFVAVVILSMMI